jgi:hypothetical protein
MEAPLYKVERMLLHDFAGTPVFIIWFEKDGVECFRTYPHDVEAAGAYIESVRKSRENKNEVLE